MQLIQGWGLLGLIPRVARASHPWAVGFIPFGELIGRFCPALVLMAQFNSLIFKPE